MTGMALFILLAVFLLILFGSDDDRHPPVI